MHTLPINFAEADDPVLGQKVQSLLHSAHQLTALKGRKVHAFEYILRGPDHIKTSLNSLSELEYVYGLYRLQADPRTPTDAKPFLAKHIAHVVEDGSEFKWGQVRSWSEEVITKVADGRLKWTDVMEIHSLRTSRAQACSGRLHSSMADSYAQQMATYQPAYKPPNTTFPPPGYRPNIPAAAGAPRYSQPATAQNVSKPTQSRNASNRSDLPCKDFNSVTGCKKQDGHTDNGHQHGHHCSWCRINLQKIHYHNEPICRSKGDPYNPMYFRA